MQERSRPEGEMLRRRFEWLRELNDDEVSELSRCEEGDGLMRGEEYFDVSHPERGVIRGDETERAAVGSCYVAKSAISPGTWQHVIGLYGGHTHTTT